jgi:hypothetical protein
MFHCMSSAKAPEQIRRKLRRDWLSASSVRSTYLRLAFAILPMIATPRAPGAELSATGISIPFFTDAGKLTHRMKASSAVKTGTVQTMHEVEIQYFAPGDPSLIVQKVQMADATWDDQKQTLVGGGTVVVATVESRLTGEGFDFALETALLRIHRNFTLTNDDVRLTSNRAIIELIVEKKDSAVKVRDVRRCEAVGDLHIVVQPAAHSKYGVREAFSHRAIYDGATGIITLPEPKRTLQADGGQGNFNTLTLNLRDPAKPSTN